MPTGLMIRVPPWRTPTGQSGGAERSPDSVHDRCQLLQLLVSGFEVVAWLQMPCDGSPECPTLGSQWATQGVAIRPTRSGQAWRIRSGRRRGRYFRDSVFVPSQRTHRSFTAKIAKNAKNIAMASHDRPIATIAECLKITLMDADSIAITTTKAPRHEGFTKTSQFYREDRQERKEHHKGIA